MNRHSKSTVEQSDGVGLEQCLKLLLAIAQHLVRSVVIGNVADDDLDRSSFMVDERNSSNLNIHDGPVQPHVLLFDDRNELPIVGQALHLIARDGMVLGIDEAE